MHLQKVQNPPLKALRGILLVTGLVAGLVLLSMAMTALSPWIGGTASMLAFYALGALVALWVMRRFILGYSYAMNQSLLRLSHVYGKYERLISDVYFNNVVSAGTPDEVRARHPDARVQRCLLKTCPIEPFAVAYRDDGRICVALIQPDETIRARLTEAAKANRR